VERGEDSWRRGGGNAARKFENVKLEESYGFRKNGGFPRSLMRIRNGGGGEETSRHKRKRKGLGGFRMKGRSS